MYMRPSRSECLFPVSRPTINSGSGEFFIFLFRLCTCKNTVAVVLERAFLLCKALLLLLETDFAGTRYLGSDRPTRIRNRDSGNRKQTFTSGWPEQISVPIPFWISLENYVATLLFETSVTAIQQRSKFQLGALKLRYCSQHY